MHDVLYSALVVLFLEVAVRTYCLTIIIECKQCLHLVYHFENTKMWRSLVLPHMVSYCIEGSNNKSQSNK